MRDEHFPRAEPVPSSSSNISDGDADAERLRFVYEQMRPRLVDYSRDEFVLVKSSWERLGATHVKMLKDIKARHGGKKLVAYVPPNPNTRTVLERAIALCNVKNPIDDVVLSGDEIVDPPVVVYLSGNFFGPHPTAT